jgi:hypothetical protein
MQAAQGVLQQYSALPQSLPPHVELSVSLGWLASTDAASRVVVPPVATVPPVELIPPVLIAPPLAGTAPLPVMPPVPEAPAAALVPPVVVVPPVVGTPPLAGAPPTPTPPVPVDPAITPAPPAVPPLAAPPEDVEPAFPPEDGVPAVSPDDIGKSAAASRPDTFPDFPHAHPVMSTHAKASKQLRESILFMVSPGTMSRLMIIRGIFLGSNFSDAASSRFE